MTTVNALFDYFDHQFSDAGSPSKVEETVGTGLLPNKPEHTLPDVASLFKKIITGLPGGLLGSVKIFEAMRAPLLDSESAIGVIGSDRARLVALAISSISSLYRQHLIHAVVGLVAYFAFEADKAEEAIKAEEAEKVASGTQGQQNQPGSALMDYFSMGRMFGPVLLGDLTDNVHVQKTGGQPLGEVDLEKTKKGKKPKQTSVPDKLDTGALTSTPVKQHMLTVDVMHSLLLNWREIVTQLRNVDAFGTSSSQLVNEGGRHEKAPVGNASEFTPESSAENLQSINFSRKRTPPEKEMGIKSRSPMPQLGFQSSEASHFNRTSPPKFGREDDEYASPAKNNVAHSAGSQSLFTEDFSGLESDEQGNSDLEMDPMAMGTILTRRRDTLNSREKPVHSNDASLEETPCKQSRTGSSSKVPETVLRRPPTPAERKASIRLVSQPMKDKPLSPSLIGHAQRMGDFSSLKYDDADDEILPNTKLSQNPPSGEGSFSARESRKETAPPKPEFEDEPTFPPRQQSLSQHQYYQAGAIDSIPQFESVAEQKAWVNADPPSPSLYPISHRTDAVVNRYGQTTDEAKKNCGSSVRALAQKPAQVSKETEVRGQNRQVVTNALPRAYAHVQTAPGQCYPRDASDASPAASPLEDSMVPRPVKDLARGRKAGITKSPGRLQRPSAYDQVFDKDAEVVKANQGAQNSNSQNMETDTTQALQLQNTQSMDPRKAKSSIDTHPNRPFSHDSSKDSEFAFDAPKVGHETRTEGPPIGGTYSPGQTDVLVPAKGQLTAGSSVRADSYRDVDDALKKFERERRESMDPGLYQGIIHLRQMIEQHSEGRQAATRSLDVVKETAEVGYPNSSKLRSLGSWSKEMCNEDAKEAEKGMNFGKRRAEVAETKYAKRLDREIDEEKKKLRA